MKARVAEMESKSTKLHDQLNSELQDVKDDLRAAKDDCDQLREQLKDVEHQLKQAINRDNEKETQDLQEKILIMSY